VRGLGLPVVTLLWAVGITIGRAANVARVVEPYSEIPAAETTGWDRLLVLARVHVCNQLTLYERTRY